MPTTIYRHSIKKRLFGTYFTSFNLNQQPKNMKQQTVDKYIGEYGEIIQELATGGTEAEYHRYLRLLIKEVERDTRYAAIEEVNKLTNSIQNLHI